jgi:hypothetical protein
MNRGIRQGGWVWVLAACAGLLGGCVERRFVVYSDPPGAIVYENGMPLGAAPADHHFVYYGKYHFTLVRDGFQTLQVDQEISQPWYEFPGLDFISENLIPWTIRDVRRFYYALEPLQVPNTRELRDHADALRARGLAIQPPPTPVNGPPGVPVNAPPLVPPAVPVATGP